MDRPTHPSHPTPSIPSHQTRTVGLVLMCEHWTPKGDCKVTGHKESQLYKRNPFKKFSPSMLHIEIPSKFKKWNRLQFNRRNTFKNFHLQFYKKNPFKIYLTHLQFYIRNPFKFCSEKKSTLKFGLKIPPRT